MTDVENKTNKSFDPPVSDEFNGERNEGERNEGERNESSRDVWSSERAFVFSTAAAAVGLGNLWRFPTLVGENGGGVFLFAYAIAVVFVAVPFAALELAAGRQAHGSVVASYKRLGPGLFLFGWLTVLLTLFISSYYFVVTGWTLGFALGATFGAVPDFEAYNQGYQSVWYLFALGAIVGAVLIFGISGIERMARILMPVMVLLVLGLAIFSLFVGETRQALNFLFKPDMTRFSDLSLWRAAFGQAFFSMMIGQGFLITYGSYLPERINLPRSVLSIASLNSSVAILAGLAIFPLVFASGLDPAIGSQLAFVTLPKAFDFIGTAIPLAAIFFWLLFFAAISSCIGGAKVVAAALYDQSSGLKSWVATWLAIGAIVALGIPSALSYAVPQWTLWGEPVLDAFNRMVGSNGTVVLAISTALILGWRFSGDHLARRFGLRGPMAMLFNIVVRTIPIILVIMFGAEFVLS